MRTLSDARNGSRASRVSWGTRWMRSWMFSLRNSVVLSRSARSLLHLREVFSSTRAFFFLLSGPTHTHLSFACVCKRLLLTLSISILLHRNYQQVKPITKLAARSSPRTRTSTTPRSTDLSSDSRTDALFAKLSTPPSRVM